MPKSKHHPFKSSRGASFAMHPEVIINYCFVKILSKILVHAKVDITYNAYINLYGDGFDEMLAALDAC